MSTYHTETSNKISESLWSLLERFSFDDITITMVCQHAHVGRRSFYRHFKTKRDVLTNSIAQKCYTLSTYLAQSRSMEEMLNLSFKFFYQQRTYLRLLHKNGLFQELTNIIQAARLFDEVLDIFIDRYHLSVDMREYAANVASAVYVAILATWTQHGFRKDWQQLAHFELSVFPFMQWTGKGAGEINPLLYFGI